MTSPGVKADYDALLDYQTQVGRALATAQTTRQPQSIVLPRTAAAFGWMPNSLAVQEAWDAAVAARGSEVEELRALLAGILTAFDELVRLYQLTDEQARRRIEAHDG